MLNISELEIATKGRIVNGSGKVVPSQYITDSRESEQEAFYVPIVGAKVDGHTFILDCVKRGIVGYFISSHYEKKDYVIAESIRINKDICIIEVEETSKALYDSGVYNREKHIDIPIVAVTGSVGKTSTREMIASVLKQEKNILVTKKNYNSYIGLPIMMLQLDNQDLCVFEVGIDHIGEMEQLSYLVKPDVAAITMIGTAHIGIFGNQDVIFQEKLKITNNIKGMATLIVNGDDPYLKTVRNTDNYVVKQFKIENARKIEQHEDRICFKTNIHHHEEDIQINEIGNHNIYNALCAIKIAELFDYRTENIIQGIAEYRNFKGRLEKKKLKDDIIIIDDTYNASIDSMVSGLVTVDKLTGGRKIAILGDMFELGEYSQTLHEKIGEVFKDLHFDLLYTLGEASQNIAKEASKYLPKDCVKAFEDKEVLLEQLKQQMQPGDILYFKASNLMKFSELIQKLEQAYQ